jgi:predicted DNA-binding ArsR family transcriptional regulator
MKRIKVISDPTDLVPMLHAMDSDIKRQVFTEVSAKWCLKSTIQEMYGDEGIDALNFFLKMKLVQTRWEPTPKGVDMAYMSYYTTFHIDTSCPVTEVGDILFVMAMPNNEFKVLEKKIVGIVETGENFPRTIAKNLDISEIMLKCIVKRSGSLEFKGMKVMKAKLQ